MATTINAGTASGGAAISADTTGILQLQSGSTPTTAVTIDASQNVGIGTSSPLAKLNVSRTDSTLIGLFSGTTKGARIGANATYSYIEGVDTTGSASYQPFMIGGSDVRFTTSDTERMRIDSSGRLQINSSTDTNYQLSIATKASQGGILTNASTAGFAGIQGIHSSNSATGYAAYFNNSGSGTGLYISNTAAWVSTSDERLKEDIKDLGTTERLLQLKPKDYLWKSQKTSDNPTKRNFGFIAQELKEVFPELVGISPDGMFSVEYTGLIAPLVKAIQELNAKVTALEAQLGAK